MEGIKIECDIVPVYDFFVDEEYNKKVEQPICNKRKNKVRFEIPFNTPVNIPTSNDLISFEDVVVSFEDFNKELLHKHQNIIHKVKID